MVSNVYYIYIIYIFLTQGSPRKLGLNKKNPRCFFAYVWKGWLDQAPNIVTSTLPETNSKSTWKLMVGSDTYYFDPFGASPGANMLLVSGSVGLIFEIFYLGWFTCKIRNSGNKLCLDFPSLGTALCLLNFLGVYHVGCGWMRLFVFCRLWMSHSYLRNQRPRDFSWKLVGHTLFLDMLLAFWDFWAFQNGDYSLSWWRILPQLNWMDSGWWNFKYPPEV